MKTLSECQESEIEDLLLGRTVKKVSQDELLLDDGLTLKIVPNVGGCACSAGDYFLTHLQDVDNVITRVDVIDEDIDPYGARRYNIFVFAGNEQINLLTVEGDDGNGYYGTGYQIKVM